MNMDRKSILIDLIFLLFLFSDVIASSGTTCITPKGETAECISLLECPALLTSLKSLTEEGRQYTIQSHCGFDKKIPLVCCGTLPFNEKDPLDAILDNAEKNTNTGANLLDDFIAGLSKQTDGPEIEKLPEILSHNFNTDKLPDKSTCGLEAHESWQKDDKTDLHEAPWAVALEYKDKSSNNYVGVKCMGVLISNRYILTAASCILDKEYNLVSVRLGEWDINSDPDCNVICASPVENIKIVTTTPHPYYSKKMGSNNIGLIKLEKDITYTGFIRPICMQPQDFSAPEKETPMTVTGWGQMENELTSNVKLKETVQFLPFEDCQVVPKNKTLSKQFSSKLELLRACGKRSQQGVCRESLGGPVMMKYLLSDKVQNQWYLEGIISTECGVSDGTEDHFIYTRVSRYIEWILETIVKG